MVQIVWTFVIIFLVPEIAKIITEFSLEAITVMTLIFVILSLYSLFQEMFFITLLYIFMGLLKLGTQIEYLF